MPESMPLLRVVTSLLLAFVGVLIVPLIALATFNHPSPTDDYCFANTAMQYGFWEAQQLYYDGWTGRFFHNFIVHTNPLVIGWFGGYKVVPVIFLALLMGSFYALASQWLYRVAGTSSRVALAAGLFIGFMATLASIPEYLYWYTGLASYGLSSALFLLLLATMLAHQRQGFRFQPGYLLVESLLVTAIIGSSEMTMVLMLSVLGLIAFVDLIQRRRLSGTIVCLFVVAGVSVYYLMKAPGNAIRLGGNPNSSNIPLTLISSLRYMAPYIAQQVVRTPWLPLSLLYLPLAWQLTGPRLAGSSTSGLPSYLRVHPLLGMLHGFATILALISLHFYGVGIAPIPRLINVVNLTFWLSWIYNLTLWVAFLRPRLQPDRLLTNARSVVYVLLVWALASASVGPVLPVVYSDWLSGRAAQYNREMEQRYAQLAKSSDQTSLLAPLSHYPVSLFLEDIHADPKYLWNRCWADYFHKKAIILAEKPKP
ncbi:DUF6056 family protein [Spirosoma sp. KCTC 42546]|uniref:DUF6056 family protein n=1 Tax=Spirosoma sp. KCTC 42546 TaxID=2520506 RepID=UPI001FEE9AEC|nr:DUF6056 family protein [Spirosoma sp. KCTC 42546]